MFSCLDFISNIPLEVEATTSGWLDEIRLTNVSDDFFGTDMGVWDNYVYVVWSDHDEDGNDSIYFKRSINYGLSWSDDILLYNSISFQLDPRISVYENYVHIGWSDGGSTNYINSADNGENWSNIASWDGGTYPMGGGDAMEFYDIEVNISNVYILANSHMLGHIVFRQSPDNGTTWTDWVHVGGVGWPWPLCTIEFTAGILHVAAGYLMFSLSSFWINHYYSVDGGDTWNTDSNNPIFQTPKTEKILTYFVTTTHEDKYLLYYSLMDGSGTVHIGTFLNYTYASNPEIWYGPIQVIANGEGIFDADEFHIVWSEKDINNNRQLYSNITGQITDFPSNSTWPKIKLNESNIHIIWEDDRNSTLELFYTQKEQIQIMPGPPLNLDTGLSPSNLSNLVLSWDASLDDGSGENDVAGYSVYRSSTGLNGSYNFVAWIPANDSLSYNWTDFGAGDGDLNDYFYLVRANDTGNNEEQNENKVGKMVSYLGKGWNLISIPLIQSNTSALHVLQTLELNYSTIQGYHAGKSRPWLHWHRDKPNYFNDEIEINHEEGYYVDMMNPDYLVVAGKLPINTQIQLKAGWNLVGYPSTITGTRNDALSSISGLYNKVVFFNTTKGKYETVGPGDIMNPWFGYWIHATADCEWEVPL